MGFRKSLRSGLASVFGPKKQIDDGSVDEQQGVNTRKEMTERETSLQRETTLRETMDNQPRGQMTDADPIANAMFNQVGKVAVYGGGFVQNIVAKSDKHGFKLLQKRVASSAFHNSAQRIDPARCHPDTRVEIMQTIYDWIVKQGPRDEWLLWLNGAAGAGKSAIMQSVAERCVLAAIAIASFFFVRADPTRNSIAPLVATLVYQLIQAIPETSNDILLSIERNPLIFEQSLESQLHQLLIKPLLRLPTRLQRLFVIFIDGLDECNDRAHQSNLIKVLGNISSERNIPIVFLIASRREPQIEAAFCKEQVADILTTIPLDDIQASDDIRRFLNAKFKEIKATHLRRRFLSPDWPSSAVIEQIVEKSSGQFIYASVVINYISLPHAHPALQLDVINGLRPRGPSSENPFAYLDALYQHIFSQVKEPNTVLSILAFNFAIPDTVSYTIEALELVFQFAAGELEVLFADLAAIIRLSDTKPSDERVIKILHASLPDFLLDKSRSGDYYIDLGEYTTHLLVMFLERSSSISDPLSPTSNSKTEPNVGGESVRLAAIDDLLGRAKASDRLQRACMNFNCIIFSAEIVEMRRGTITSFLRRLESLDFEDQGEAYRHVVDVFAAGLAKYWPSLDEDNIKHNFRNYCPDLVARISQIRQEEL